MRVSQELFHLTSRHGSTKTQTPGVEISSQISSGAELKICSGETFFAIASFLDGLISQALLSIEAC
jgi:hypothetical protein